MTEKRSLIFRLRLSKKEKQQALQKAQALGISLSDFYRTQATQESSQIKLYLELGRLGHQLTQIASDLSRFPQEGVSTQLQAEVQVLVCELIKIRTELERR